MVRRPAVAGQFYPGTESTLEQKIEECFKHELGPGEIPSEKGNEREIKGLVCPHAGYVYSGPVAAHSYKALAEDGLPETVVILGPNHQGMGAAVSLGDEDYKTPLGTVEIDEELADSLAGGVIEKDNIAHRREHSIEVQIPFLQYFSDSFKLVPICCNKQDLRSSTKIGEKIREASEGKDVVVIASTDFSHYVLKENAEKKDKMAIEKILKNDPDGLFQTVQENNISMCGYGPVASMMVGSGGTEGELLKYATSGDVVNQREVVGYGAISFK
ncbi:MAG: MEMO1 family protein [Candidatus Thermoplasmatota archaeon]